MPLGLLERKEMRETYRERAMVPHCFDAAGTRTCIREGSDLRRPASPGCGAAQCPTLLSRDHLCHSGLHLFLCSAILRSRNDELLARWGATEYGSSRLCFFIAASPMLRHCRVSVLQ